MLRLREPLGRRSAANILPHAIFPSLPGRAVSSWPGAFRHISGVCRRSIDGPEHASARFIMLDRTASHLTRYLDLLSARQKLVASNIANADTPGYKTQDIDFQFEFMSLIQGEQPAASGVAGLPEKPDGNNVNIDREARLLAENAIRFNLASTLLHNQLKAVHTAIQEGKS
jgi:flagellar basal-body rod protein FlgB